MGIIWILAASLLGFGVAAIFAGRLKLQRNIYLLIYIPLVLLLFVSFIISNDINIKELLLHNWYWGLVGAVVAGAFVIKNVFSQPSSKRSTGLALLLDITWSGLAYGLIDALLPHMAMHIGAMIHGKETTGQVPPHYHDQSK